MKQSLLTLARTIVLVSIGILCLFSAPALFAQRLIYHVDLTQTDKHFVPVEVQLADVRPDTLVFQMPIWAPGIYSTVHYGRFIRDFQALDSSGNELPVVHPTKDLWKVPNGGNVARIRYQAEDSHSDLSSPEIGLARIDEKGLFANTEALFGYFDNDESIPATMLFNVPKGWMVATTLDPATDGATTGDAEFHQTSFNVDDYATLASSPLIAAPHFSAVQFTRDGVDYAVVAGGENAFPVDSFASATNQIARAENSFFGKVPYRRYLFVVYTGAEQPFGIAHGTSSVYTLPNGDWSAHAPAIEHLVAATMFKTWNGGQFHISQLGPVDFTEPIEARSLWFSEGVSEYYAELLRVRYGLITAPDFFTAIDNWEGLANGDGSGDTGSLESLSLRMKTFNPICVECLRARGSLAAMLMDIEIRDKTHRKHSLDNVLLRMDRDVRTGKTYNDAKFDKTLSAYSSVDLSAFYDRYICKSDVLPLEAYLEKMGAGSDVPDGMKTGNEFGLALALNTAGTAIIDAPENDSLEAEEVLADNKAKEMDLKPGDTVVAIDGENVSPESVEDAKARLAAGRLVKLALVRNAKAVPVRVKSKHPRTASDLRLALVSRPSAEQLALRNAIIGKRRLKRSKHAKFYAQTKGAR